MPVASRMRLVLAARNASGVSASNPQASAIHTESAPRRSASTTKVSSSSSAPLAATAMRMERTVAGLTRPRALRRTRLAPVGWSSEACSPTRRWAGRPSCSPKPTHPRRTGAPCSPHRCPTRPGRSTSSVSGPADHFPHQEPPPPPPAPPPTPPTPPTPPPPTPPLDDDGLTLVVLQLDTKTGPYVA